MLKTWNQIEYREIGTGENTVIIFHGGHMRATSDTGEAFFVDRNYHVIIPSRPGYGKTPLAAGPDAKSFADNISRLMDERGISQAILVGVSAGSPTALYFAQHYPDKTKALILQSALGHNGWPDTKTRLVAHTAFSPVAEGLIWGMMRLSFRLLPVVTLKILLSGLSTKNPNEALRTIRGEPRKAMIAVLAQSRSGHGFLNDLKYTIGDVSKITAPTLIIHSKYDAGVEISHPEYLAEHIQGAELFMSDAESHMFWYSDYYSEIEAKMAEFLKHV